MIQRMAGVRSVLGRTPHPQESSTRSGEPTQGIVLPSKTIPILFECDVLVVGGGPSGIAAAVSAARAGANTIIMERFGCLGGVITTVGMETIAWYRYEGTTDCKGIGIEMETLAAKLGATRKWAYNDSECLDAEFFKVVADRLIEESGVRPVLHCSAVDVIMDGTTIRGVVTSSKSGIQAIMAKRVIDCTGDADIAYMAGAEYRTNESKNSMAVTTVFNCAGVNKKEFLDYVKNNTPTYKEWESWDDGTGHHRIGETESSLPTPFLGPEFKRAAETGIGSRGVSGTWSSITDAGEATNLNLVHMKGYDCTNVLDLTAAEIEGRKRTLETIRALKQEVPGFQNAKLRNFGMTLGTRDSRKIVGVYNLTGQDVMSEARFVESVGIFPEFVDGYNVLVLPTSGRYFHVPYGCLVPVKIDNLLVAGRCIAGDNISHAAMRNMMACTVTGQAAGVASAVSIKKGVSPRNVEVIHVQCELIKQKVRIF